MLEQGILVVLTQHDYKQAYVRRGGFRLSRTSPGLTGGLTVRVNDESPSMPFIYPLH